MRPLVELFLVAMVVYAGWSQPFRDHAAAIFPNAGIQPSRTAIIAQRAARQEEAQSGSPQGTPGQISPRPLAPAQSPSWMSHQTSMDRPYKTNGNVAR